MRRKILVTGFRAIATIFLLISILLVVIIHISEKGDLIDRNANWITLMFFMAAGIFCWSFYISDVWPKKLHRKKSPDELLNEIKKSNLDKLKNRKSGY